MSGFVVRHTAPNTTWKITGPRTAPICTSNPTATRVTP